MTDRAPAWRRALTLAVAQHEMIARLGAAGTPTGQQAQQRVTQATNAALALGVPRHQVQQVIAGVRDAHPAHPAQRASGGQAA